MDLLSIALMTCWGLAAAGLGWYVAMMAKEVTYVTLADGRQQARAIPLIFKLLLPFAANLDRLTLSERWAKARTEADERLVSAGFEGLLDGREFLALRVMCPIVIGSFWCLLILFFGALLPDSMFVSCRLQLCLIGIVLFYLQPVLWLKSEIRKRHLSIMKSLPFVLDILTLSVEAGMDFISALQRNCASRKMDALNEELLRMTKEIQVGSSRKEALRAMSERVRQPDLKSVANALIQADELGVSIGSILRIQSDQLRERRFDRAERLAAQAPTKMLGPLMLCIFPAVFIILLGPVLLQALQGSLL